MAESMCLSSLGLMEAYYYLHVSFPNLDCELCILQLAPFTNL